MFRAVVTVLVAVPMLMPPGMCLCQFAPAGTTAAGTRSAAARTSVPGHSPGDGRDCRCDSCRGQALTLGGQESAPAGPPTHPEPGKHAPGCPASLGDTPTKMASPALALHLDANPAPGFVSAVVETRRARGRDRDAASHADSSPPLFLSHCSLLI
jgi:hypothetical protein